MFLRSGNWTRREGRNVATNFDLSLTISGQQKDIKKISYKDR